MAEYMEKTEFQASRAFSPAVPWALVPPRTRHRFQPYQTDILLGTRRVGMDLIRFGGQLGYGVFVVRSSFFFSSSNRK